MNKEVEKRILVLSQRIQQNAPLRKALAGGLILFLLLVAGHFVRQMLPVNYHYRMSGGDILGNRHFLAKILQQDLVKHGLTLEVVPTGGSQESIAKVERGELDFALIQGGLDSPTMHVEHVATVTQELLHILVRPDIRGIGDLRGKRINMGSKKGGTRVVTNQVLEFSGLKRDIDYVETNLSSEALLSMVGERLPEAIAIVSMVPSDVAEYMVKQHHYTLLEVPFPAALGLRLGWVNNGQILGFMYQVQPGVPERDIKTVGVNLYLIANERVDPRAVRILLERLYSAQLALRLKMQFDEKQILHAANYPLAAGTLAFVERNNPLFAKELLEKVKSALGFLIPAMSTLLLVFKWFKGEAVVQEEPMLLDRSFLTYIEQVLEVEQCCHEYRKAGRLTRQAIEEFDTRLSAIQTLALKQLESLHRHAKFENEQLPGHLLLLLNGLRNRLWHAGSAMPDSTGLQAGNIELPAD